MKRDNVWIRDIKLLFSTSGPCIVFLHWSYRTHMLTLTVEGLRITVWFVLFITLGFLHRWHGLTVSIHNGIDHLNEWCCPIYILVINRMIWMFPHIPSTHINPLEEALVLTYVSGILRQLIWKKNHMILYNYIGRCYLIPFTTTNKS